MLHPDEPPVDEHGRPVPDRLDDARESFAVERGGITLGQVVWLPRTEEQRALQVLSPPQDWRSRWPACELSFAVA